LTGAKVSGWGSYVRVSSDFERLIAYQRSAELGDAVWRAVASWPSFARWTIGKQLTRSADSIAANVAEGAGRRGSPDRRRFYGMARGSLYETEHWLKRARVRGLETPELPTDELARTLNGLIRSAGT
jgi:four helix bundle protein